jgi:hypothetical protein
VPGCSRGRRWSDGCVKGLLQISTQRCTCTTSRVAAQATTSTRPEPTSTRPEPVRQRVSRRLTEQAAFNTPPNALREALRAQHYAKLELTEKATETQKLERLPCRAHGYGSSERLQHHTPVGARKRAPLCGMQPPHCGGCRRGEEARQQFSTMQPRPPHGATARASVASAHTSVVATLRALCNAALWRGSGGESPGQQFAGLPTGAVAGTPAPRPRGPRNFLCVLMFLR